MAYRISIILLRVLLLLSLCGCNMITGERIESAKLSQLRESETTKAQVINLIGKPDHIGFGENGKGEYFVYYYSRSEMFSCEDKESQTVTLFIDDSGIVREVIVSEKP